MSTDSYQKAKQILLENKEKSYFVGPRSNNLIEDAQKFLGIKFVGSYLDFLQSFGAGSFGSQEIYGIIDSNFEQSSVPDAIWYTYTERKEVNLPSNLLVIYDTGSDELFCLDFSRTSEEDEQPVVSFVPGVDLEYQTYSVIANDFGDFLLDLINQELE